MNQLNLLGIHWAFHEKNPNFRKKKKKPQQK